MDEQLEFMRLVAERLDAEGIQYMLTGSMALAVYATPRMTRDIDVVIDCDPGQAMRFARRFVADSYSSEEAAQVAAETKGMFNVIHNESLIKADFILLKGDEYHHAAFARRRSVELGDFAMSIVAPEDLILAKLAWARDTGSEQQGRDVRALLTVVSGLDEAYLSRWAAYLQVSPQLDVARRP